MMTKESHRLPNGSVLTSSCFPPLILPISGIRLGIVKVLLHLAQSPEHVRVAVHALTVYQDRNPQAVLEQEVCRVLKFIEPPLDLTSFPLLVRYPRCCRLDPCRCA